MDNKDLLDGVVVVDMVGAKLELTGRLLADMGADVIRVEPPQGAVSRLRPPFADNGVSVFHAVRNTGKRSVTADLADSADREFLGQLLATADILIEDDQEALRRAGLGAQALLDRNPRLVVLSVSDFGLTGPYASYTATDPVQLAVATQLSRSGIPGREPLLPPGRISHEASAFQAVWAGLVGYYHRLKTGLGDHLDQSIFEATLQVMDPPLGTIGTASAATQGAASGTAPDPDRGRPASNMYPIFKCADGYVRLVILSPRQWLSMWDWLGRPERFADRKYYGHAGRYADRAELYPLYEELFRDRLKSEVTLEGQSRGIPLAPVASIADVLCEPHYEARGTFVEAEIADGVTARIPSGFFEVDGDRIGYRRRAPRLGEDNEAVRQELSQGLRARPAVSGPPSRATHEPGGQRPLEGLRVIDFGVYIFGSEVGRLLADMGADVIKVENRAFPDGTRAVTAAPMSATFAVGHRNERSLGINLRDAAGVAIIKKLAAKSHVVISNYKPGTLEKLGLGYEELSEVNPGIVWMSGSGFGHTGPWADFLGYGPLVRSASGLTSLWRYPDDESSFCEAVTIYPDHFAGRVGAVAVLAALIRQHRTGQGADIRLSQAESAINHLSEEYAYESLRKGSGAPQGNASPWGAPWGVYPCLGDDEWCVITITGNQEWESLIRVMGSPEWAGRAEFSRPEGRIAHRAELDALVSDWTRQQAPGKLTVTLQGAGVPGGAMRRRDELFEDPHLRARNFIAWLDQPGLDGPVAMEWAPFLSRRIAPPELRPAPFQGQHTTEVVAQILGLSDAEIAELIEQAVLEPQEPDPRG
jgi:crotonobetainyl-CoA:carnitine CoA-transferase CaiB-like acyl-CoA transferase